MRKLITTAAFLTVLAPVAAQADELKTFQHQRDTYVYETAKGDNGATVITGRRMGGERFRLVVKGQRVTGNVGNTPVAFRAPQNGAVTVVAAN
jgi:hypothetical protein